MIKMLVTGCDMCSTFIISVNEWPDTDSKVSNAHDIWILLNALSNGGKKQIPNNKIWDKFIQKVLVMKLLGMLKSIKRTTISLMCLI